MAAVTRRKLTPWMVGPIVWTLISEIYPNRVRGRAISVRPAGPDALPG